MLFRFVIFHDNKSPKICQPNKMKQNLNYFDWKRVYFIIADQDGRKRLEKKQN